MRRIFIYSLLFAWIGAQAQNSTLHLDRPYYISGEYLFYSIGSSYYQDDTVAVQVQFYSNERLVDSHYKLLIGGVGKGWVKLPFELPSAVYELAVSSFDQGTFMRNNLVRQEVAVYRTSDRNIYEGKIVVGEQSSPLDLAPQIAVEQPRLDYRDTVRLKFELPLDLRDDLSHISVSVRDFDLYGVNHPAHFSIDPTRPPSASISGIPFEGRRILEERGMITNPLLFAFNANDLRIDATQVDQQDEFRLEITPFTGRRRITFIDYLDRTFSIEEERSDNRPVVGGVLEVDSSIVAHLAVVEKQRQINQRFKHFDLMPDFISTSSSLPFAPNYFVDVQDFNIRGTTVSLFKELISPLKFKSIGSGDYRARVLYERNDIKKFYSRPPMFIVNNAATRNGPYVAKFPLQEVKYFKIYSLYDELEAISPIAFGGLIYVDMMDPNYVLDKSEALPSMHLDGLQQEVQYPVVPTIGPGIPSTASLLYWHPDIEVVDGSVDIRFSSADVATRYVIEVVVHLADGSAKRFHHQVEVASTP